MLGAIILASYRTRHDRIPWGHRPRRHPQRTQDRAARRAPPTLGKVSGQLATHRQPGRRRLRLLATLGVTIACHIATGLAVSSDRSAAERVPHS